MMSSLDPRKGRIATTLAAAMVAVLWTAAPPLLADTPEPQRERGENASVRKVFAYTLKHQPAHEALAQIRRFLSPAGTVEVQPGGNTLVVRDLQAVLTRIAPVLEDFDHPPQDLRFDIQIVRAGAKRHVISPPIDPEPGDSLPEPVLRQLRSLLRFDDYEVLARAEMSSQEGEDVTYSLGRSYKVSFRPGTVMAGPSGHRVRLEQFRIQKNVETPANKGRQLDPQELFHATLNLWIDRPFSLVLPPDGTRKEALVVAISCQREESEP